MATGKEIKGRIKSVKNTRQITKAMEMVSASKMRRAQQRVIDARPYAEKIGGLIQHLAKRNPEFRHPFLVPREVKNIGIVLVTTDRGLCGALNSNTLRMVTRFMLESKVPVKLVTVGRKGRDFMHRYGRTIAAEVTGISDRPQLNQILPQITVAIDEFKNGNVDEVYVAYAEFVNTMTQRPVLKKILPATLPEGEAKAADWDYLYEPESRDVLNLLMPRYVEAIVYRSLLENVASEHSARMVAMKNASDNAKNLVKELTLTYNQARQAAVTKEIAEIVSGASAVQ